MGADAVPPLIGLAALIPVKIAIAVAFGQSVSNYVNNLRHSDNEIVRERGRRSWQWWLVALVLCMATTYTLLSMLASSIEAP